MPTEPQSSAATTGEPAAHPGGAAAISISPWKVKPNPLNPRMFFDQASIETLAESIEEIGVLVPITIYEDPDDAAGTTHVLLDGERRLRASQHINYPLVPAWVIAKPDGVNNVVRMFNIHMLRRDWDEIATAWALEKLQEQVGTRDVVRLAHLTGLSRDRIRNMQTVLAFPREMQERVANGEIKFQFLVELEKNILSKARRQPETLPGVTEVELQDAFVQKYLDENAETVELRKVGKLMTTAQDPGAVGTRAKAALNELVREREMTIEEAYESGAAASVELRRVLRDIEDLPTRIHAVLESELQPDQRNQMVNAITNLHHALAEIAGPNS